MARKKKKKTGPPEPAPEPPLSPRSAARRQFLAAVHDGESSEAVRELLRTKELIPDEPDQDGHTPLWLAAVHGAAPVVRVLIEAGAAVNEKSPADKATALHGAVIHGHDDTVCVLLEAKADIESRSNCGQTPLMHACSAALSSTVSCLLQANADPNATNPDGYTALLLSNSVACCELVLRQFAAKLPKTAEVPRAHDAGNVGEAAGLPQPFIRPPRDSKVGLWFESCLGAWELLGKEREVVFPFHHLPDYATEVLHVCTVAEVILGREFQAAIAAVAPNPGLSSALYQSCFYAIVEAGKHLITCESCGESSQDSAIAREELWHFTLAAYQELYGNSSELQLCGVPSASVLGALVDMIAAAFFGPSFWSKRVLFVCDDPLEQRRLCKQEDLEPLEYFLQVPLEVEPTQEAVTSAERRLHAYTSAGCALVADVIPGIHPAYSEMTMRQMLLDCELLHDDKKGTSLRRRRRKKKQGHIQQPAAGATTELAAGVRSSIIAFWGRLDRTARRQLLQIPDISFDEAIRRSPHWDLLKYFDENYDEFGPKGLLDIDDSSGHITVGKELLGNDSIGQVLDAKPHTFLEPVTAVVDRVSGKTLYEGLALWLMREQLLSAHGESSREEAALRLQDELIRAEEQELAAKKRKKGKNAPKKAPSKALLELEEEEEEEEEEAREETIAEPDQPEVVDISAETNEYVSEVDEMLGVMVASTQRRNKNHTNVKEEQPARSQEVNTHHQEVSKDPEEDKRGASKVRLCQRYFNTGECNRRNVCWYAHSLEEMEPNARRNFKTRPCHAFQSGNCKFGQCCTFAHGQAQLRSVDDPVVLPTVCRPCRPDPVAYDPSSRHRGDEKHEPIALPLPVPLPRAKPPPVQQPPEQQKQQRAPVGVPIGAPVGAVGRAPVGVPSTQTETHVNRLPPDPRELVGGLANLSIGHRGAINHQSNAGGSSLLLGFADSSDPVFNPSSDPIFNPSNGSSAPQQAVGQRVQQLSVDPFGATDAVLMPTLNLISDPDEDQPVWQTF